MSRDTIKLHCLTCASSSSTVSQVDKSDVLFLLRILLQVPQDSHLFYTIKSSLNSVKVCEQCTSSIKQCRQLYTEIGQRIEKFWEVQNKILGKITSSSSATNKNKKDDSDEIICEDDNQSSYNNWVDQCRKYVKDHHFGGFGYPFVVQDLGALLSSLPPPPTQSSILTKHVTVDLTRVVKKEVPGNSKEDNDDLGDFGDDFPEGSPQSPEHVPSSEKLGDTTATIPDNQCDDDVIVKEEREPEIDDEEENFGDDGNYSGNSDDDSGSDDDYQPPSKKTRSSVTKPAHKEDKPVIKHNYPKVTQKWSKYKKDPITGRLICEWPGCDKQFSYSSSAVFRAHLDKHKGTPNQKCDQCDLKFYKKTQLVQHKEAVHGNKEFCCEICGKKYRNSVRLAGHRREVHFEYGKKIVCDICGRSMTKNYLRHHMKRSHLNNMRKYYCQFCPSVYEKEIELKMHLLRVHEFCEKEEENELILEKIEKRKEAARMSFKCHVIRCRTTYRSKEALEKHVEEKHGGRWDQVEDEAGEDFKCEICGKGWHDRRRFNEHMKRHKNLEGENFKCEICGRCLPGKVSFDKHMITHGEEKDKPWRCEVCGRGYVEEKVLRKHLESKMHKKKLEEGNQAE